MRLTGMVYICFMLSAIFFLSQSHCDRNDLKLLYRLSFSFQTKDFNNNRGGGGRLLSHM